MNARGEIYTFPQFLCGKVLIIVEKSDNNDRLLNNIWVCMGKTLMVAERVFALPWLWRLCYTRERF